MTTPRKRAVAAAACLALLVALGRVLPLRHLISSCLELLAGLGAWGPVALGALYVPAAILLVPGAPMTLGAGFVFGVGRAFIAVSVGSTLGACAAFLVGRSLGGEWARAKIGQYPRFAAVSKAVGQRGFFIVLLTRLSPMFPYNALNYAFSLTEVSFPAYALASWLGMIPGALMYVYIGASARSLADTATGQLQRSPAQSVLFWIGLAATVAVTVLVTRIARRALNDLVETQ